MLQKTSHFMRQANLINGEWVQADSGQTIDVINPATGLKIGTVPKAGGAETRRAIEAAEEAFKSFRKTSALERSKLLRKLHDAIMDNQDVLAELLTLEQGKSLTESRGEVGSSAAYVLWFAEEARRTYGDVVPSPWADRRILVTKEPVGVVAAITPWNFPSSMLSRKLGPALAAGCTAVVKPASQTPYSGLAWGALCEEVGFPKGVVNIVTGSAGEIGDELCTNPLVKKITFTGSTEIGKMLIQKSAMTVKKVSMELGGNAPFLVFDDADLDRAVQGAIAAKYRNSGQTCVCTNRFFVQEGIYDKFVEKLAEASKKLKVGSGLDDGVQQGPLIDVKAVEKVEEFIEDAVAKGGKIVSGGKRHALGGSFFEPTVISGAKSNMKFMKDEIFGPIAPVFKFKTEAEAIEQANDT
ncbi:MAG: NAD-dependent succinate-semialdehyde dehydrogenase, partial [Mesorhizobium sp.]|nr:NAD-dependent succinate-semialdehyde dehydrogenase [Mesorhizobium sp.]